jgi:hypothetical protein
MPPLPETPTHGKIYAILEAPSGAIGCLGPSRVREGGGSGRQVVKSCLPMSTVMRKRDDADCSQVQFFLGWWPSSSAKSGEAISGIGCMVPQPFDARGNRSYPEFLGHNR